MKNILLTTALLLAYPLTIIIAANSTAPDNTAINERDSSVSEVTADQQGTSARDQEITQKIRQAVIQDTSLSVYGHNVKIITENGHVTLKGPVRSLKEKAKICRDAWNVVG